MDSNGLSLRKLATILGVSQPFLSQIRAGKRPLPEGLRRKVEALGAYHLLIGDKQISESPGDEGAGKAKKPPSQIADLSLNYVGAGGGTRTPDLSLGKQTLYH